MYYVFRVGSPPLLTDSAVKLLQCIVYTADRFLIGILLAAWIPPLLSLNADRVGVMHNPPGGNLDTRAADQARFLRRARTAVISSRLWVPAM